MGILLGEFRFRLCIPPFGLVQDPIDARGGGRTHGEGFLRIASRDQEQRKKQKNESGFPFQGFSRNDVCGEMLL